ncbi:MAG TPA: DUF5684 domain-containing protein [Vicinamibacteria bacterium]|nr:DUF5684 domain-containing protein [Vicinamibacteria bacterium]
MGVMLLLAAAFQEDTNPSSGGAGLIGALFGGAFFLVWLAVIVLIFVSLWKIFEKAGKPGWAGIVPIYNAIVLLEIVGRPIWWFVLLLVPCVGIVVGIILCIDLAKSFGKDAGYGIGLALLGFVFFPMLAFGDARYVGPAAGTPARV